MFIIKFNIFWFLSDQENSVEFDNCLKKPNLKFAGVIPLIIFVLWILGIIHYLTARLEILWQHKTVPFLCLDDHLLCISIQIFCWSINVVCGLSVTIQRILAWLYG